MTTPLKTQLLITNPFRSLLASAVFVLVFFVCNSGFAFKQYKNAAEEDGSNCSECHGNFDDNTSTKGSVFPGGDKHSMHNGNSAMNTDCTISVTQKSAITPS